MSNANTVAETLDFADNSIYAAICGPLDRHLALVEHTTDISISRAGNRLLLQGEKEGVMHGVEIFEHLVKKIEEKEKIDEEDVKGALRFAGYEIRSHERAMSPVEPQNDALLTPRKNIVARSPAQGAMIKALKTKSLIFGIGPAGTGKTYLAVAAAVSALVSGKVERIILSRPAVEAGERIGFLPGDMKEKVDPYMQPLYDALQDCLPSRQLARMYEDKTIEIAPLAFMRGRTLSRSFVVLDEAQNASTLQMKMFLTRLGEGAKMAITGDASQVDLPSFTKSGLIDAVNRLEHIDGVAVCKFSHLDVVRHPLVAEIIRAYDDE